MVLQMDVDIYAIHSITGYENVIGKRELKRRGSLDALMGLFCFR